MKYNLTWLAVVYIFTFVNSCIDRCFWAGREELGGVSWLSMLPAAALSKYHKTIPPGGRGEGHTAAL